MRQVHIIGIDLAKQGFQLHGAREDKVGETPWDYAKANATLKGTKPCRRMNDAWVRQEATARNGI